MPFAPNAPIDLALKERIRVAYYDEGRPVVEVEEVAGVGRATFYRWLHAWNWPLRKPMRSRKDAPAFVKDRGPASAAGGPEAGTPPWRTTAREPLKLRLKRLVEHRIAILEHEAMAGVAVDADANARAIELNARTLVTIERLGGDPEPCPHCSDDGRPQRSLSELRDELYGHLLRIHGERSAGRESCGDDDDEAGDAVPASGAMDMTTDEPSHA